MRRKDVLPKDLLGRRGEALAAAHLERAGLRIIDANWRCPFGELDLVASDGDELVIVEVKTRSSMAFGDPFSAVTREKRARLWRLAAAWRDAHPATRWRTTRLDVVAVIASADGAVAIDHLQDLR